MQNLDKMRTIALYATLAFCTTAALIIFSVNTWPKGGWAERYRRVKHPNPPLPLLPPPPNPIEALGSDHRAQTASPLQAWEFDYRRDGRRFGLTEAQCGQAFPDLYHEIDRAVGHRQKLGKNVTLAELDVTWRGDGIVRAMVHENQLYVIDAHGVWDHNHRPRALATLHAINRAVATSSEALPDVEFTFTDHDSALIDLQSNFTTWAYSRLKYQDTLWLMPDFGFWAWPDVGQRSYAELQTILDADEDEFEDKVPKLVWRGALDVGSHDARAGLLRHSAGQKWSDVQTLNWTNSSDIRSKRLTMDEHCAYMLTAHTEGNTYSGRLKYLLNCHSILLSHELKWIEHFHHLLRPSGAEQNYVRLHHDFSDLRSTMAGLLRPSNLASASRTIANNARATFRERYLTPAAEACYWRALIRGWARVQGFEVQLWAEGEAEMVWQGSMKTKRYLRGTPWESYAIMEATEWDIPAKARRLCVEE